MGSFAAAWGGRGEPICARVVGAGKITSLGPGAEKGEVAVLEEGGAGGKEAALGLRKRVADEGGDQDGGAEGGAGDGAADAGMGSVRWRGRW